MLSAQACTTTLQGLGEKWRASEAQWRQIDAVDHMTAGIRFRQYKTMSTAGHLRTFKRGRYHLNYTK